MFYLGPTKQGGQKVVIMKAGLAKKTEKKNKGELIEQNMDALEVSLSMSLFPTE